MRNQLPVIAYVSIWLIASAPGALSRAPQRAHPRPPSANAPATVKPAPAVKAAAAEKSPAADKAPAAPDKAERPVHQEPAAEARTVADKWALIIGISKFKDTTMNLKFPAKDARDLYQYLITDGNFAPDHVKLLLNEDATREKILSYLGDKWLPRVANPNDLVLIYISSHGSPSTLDVGGVNYLVAHDTNKQSLFSTGIPMQDLVRIIKGRVHSDRICLLLDACHSGAANPDSKAVFNHGNVNVDEIVQGTGQLVISSSAPDQVSWESVEQPNGVFTRYLIEGLRQNGACTKLGDAYQYMRDKVQQEVLRDRGVLQTPVLRSKWEGSELVISAPPAKPRAGLKELPPDKPEQATAPGAAEHGASNPPVLVAARPPVAAAVTPAPKPQTAAPVEVTLWNTYMDTARKNRLEGRFAEAEKILGAAQTEAENFPMNDPRRTATSCELADLFVGAERYSDAEPIYWRVLPELEKAAKTQPVELAVALTNLGQILWIKGKVSEAEAMCKRALSIREKANAADEGDAAKCLDILALTNFQAGDYAEASKLAHRAFALRERPPARIDRRLANNAMLLAKIYAAQEKLAEAEPYCQKALALNEQVFGKGSLELADSLDVYAGVLSRNARLPEAKKLEYKSKLIRSRLGKPAPARY